MIQPYITTIEETGERSTVVIAGEPTFTMQKKPQKGGFLVHQHWGGAYVPTNLTNEDTAFINSITASFTEKPIYMRVDYVYGESNEQMLLELEMIEPNLYFSQNPQGLELLISKLSLMIDNISAVIER